MQLHNTVFHDNTFEELEAIKACKFMLTMYPWRLNGRSIQIWSSCKKGLSIVILRAENPQLPVLQTRSQWCCASPAKDAFPSCLVLSWDPQHPSYRARRYLNQSKGKTKRRLLLEIVRLTVGIVLRTVSNSYVQIGSGSPPQHVDMLLSPRPRWLCQVVLKARNCLFHSGLKYIRADLLCFLGPLQHCFHSELFFPEEEGVVLSFHHRSISIPAAN